MQYNPLSTLILSKGNQDPGNHIACEFRPCVSPSAPPNTS